MKRTIRSAGLAVVILASLLLSHASFAGAQASAKKIVFLAGPRDHGAPGRHEYEKDLRALAWAVEHSPNVSGVTTSVNVGSFGSVLEYWEQRGGLDRLLDTAHLPLMSAYCPFNLTDASVRRAEVAKAAKWGALIKKYGGTVAVVGPNDVERQSFVFAQNRASIVSALNDIGRALADVGVIGALHQHTGSCVMTHDELYAVMDAADTRVVKLAPDVGELQNAGMDPVQVITDFLPLIRHVHLKDFDGGATHDGYCPLGRGRVDIAGVVDAVERSHQPLMMMVELNPAKGASEYSPFEAARESREFLRKSGYQFPER